MPWLGEYGWLPTWLPSFELISATRPLLEHLTRERLVRRAGVTVYEGVRATGLRRQGSGWQVLAEDGATFEADRVIDASGRSSRMPHWVEELGVHIGEPDQVDAHLGYACRLYRANGRPPLTTGVFIAGTPVRSAAPRPPLGRLLARDRRRLRRPPADPRASEFDAYLAELRDPAVADVAAGSSRSATSRSTGRPRTGATGTGGSAAGRTACSSSATPGAPSTRCTGKGSRWPPSRRCCSGTPGMLRGCSAGWTGSRISAGRRHQRGLAPADQRRPAEPAAADHRGLERRTGEAGSRGRPPGLLHVFAGLSPDGPRA